MAFLASGRVLAVADEHVARSIGPGEPGIEPRVVQRRAVRAGLAGAADLGDSALLERRQTDIDSMIQRGLVPHDELIARFRSAVEVFRHDARAEDLPKYIEHLHRVERDMLDVDETEIELPPWV